MKKYYRRNREKLRARERERYHAERTTDEGQERQRRRVAETRRRKQRWLIRIKKESGCVDCREDLPHYVLEFDHCRGDKKFSLGAYGRVSWANLKTEVEKCDVVCANCHKEREWRRWRKEVATHDDGTCLICGGDLRRHQLRFCSVSCRDQWRVRTTKWAEGQKYERAKRQARDRAKELATRARREDGGEVE